MRMKVVESHELVWTLLHIRQIPGEQMKTPPDTLPCAPPFTRYSQFGTCWPASVRHSSMGMYYKKYREEHIR
jgi:hypothetical protein